MRTTLQQNNTVARHLWFHYHHQLPGSVLRRDRYLHKATEANDPLPTNHMGIPSFQKLIKDRPEDHSKKIRPYDWLYSIPRWSMTLCKRFMSEVYK